MKVLQLVGLVCMFVGLVIIGGVMFDAAESDGWEDGYYKGFYDGYDAGYDDAINDTLKIIDRSIEVNNI